MSSTPMRRCRAIERAFMQASIGHYNTATELAAYDTRLMKDMPRGLLMSFIFLLYATRDTDGAIDKCQFIHHTSPIYNVSVTGEESRCYLTSDEVPPRIGLQYPQSFICFIQRAFRCKIDFQSVVYIRYRRLPPIFHYYDANRLAWRNSCSLNV